MVGVEQIVLESELPEYVLGQIKGSALHKVFQDKLVSVKQEVIRSLLVNDGFVDNLLKDFGLAQ